MPFLLLSFGNESVSSCKQSHANVTGTMALWMAMLLSLPVHLLNFQSTIMVMTAISEKVLDSNLPSPPAVAGQSFHFIL